MLKRIFFIIMQGLAAPFLLVGVGLLLVAGKIDRQGKWSLLP